MAIVTRPQNKDFDAGYDSTFGRKCFFCRKNLDPENKTEWDGNSHATCDTPTMGDSNSG